MLLISLKQFVLAFCSSFNLIKICVKGITVTFLGGNDVELPEGNKLGQKRYTHKPVYQLMGSVAFLWLVDFLAFLYYLFTLYLIFSNPPTQYFSVFQNLQTSPLIFCTLKTFEIHNKVIEPSTLCHFLMIQWLRLKSSRG